MKILKLKVTTMSGETSFDERIKSIREDLDDTRSFLYDAILSLVNRGDRIERIEQQSKTLSSHSSIFQEEIVGETTGRIGRVWFYWRRDWWPKVVAVFVTMFQIIKWIFWRTPCKIFFSTIEDESEDRHLTQYTKKIQQP